MPVPTRQLLVDWDGDGVPQSSDPYEDVTADLIQTKTIRMRHGRDQVKELSPLMAGFLEFVLGNTSLRYSDDNASSPIYGQVVPGRLVNAKVTFGQGYAQTVLNDAPSGYWRLGENAPATLAADTFDRADSAVSLGTASDGSHVWTVGNYGDAATLPTWGIVSNKAALIAAGTVQDRHAWIETGLADAVVSCDVTVNTAASAQTCGFVVRRVDGSNYFWVDLYNFGDLIRISRNLAGVRSTVASTALTLADSQTVALRVELSGSTIRVYADGVLKLTYTDTNLQTATKHGLYESGSTTSRFDNFSVTALPASAADASGNGRDGTYTGGVTLAQSGAIAAELDGTLNTAALFDGSSGYVATAAPISITGAITIAAWVAPNGAWRSVGAEIAVCQDSAGNYIAVSNGFAFASIRVAGTQHTLTAPSALSGTGWHYLAVTFDGTTMRLYVDGQLVNSGGPFAGALSATPSVVNIGRFPSGSNYFKGYIDEPEIEPTALSAARVLAHYNAGRDQAVSDQQTYQHFEGYLQLPGEHPLRSDQNVSFSALDAAGRFNAQNVETAMYTNIRTDVAIGYVLDAMGWSATKRRLDTGAYTMPCWFGTGKTGFQLIRDIVLTEGPPAVFYIDPTDGYAVFEGRHFRLLTSRCTTSQVTIRDTGTEPCYSRSDPKNGAENIVNSVTIKAKTFTTSAGQPLTVGGAALPLTLPPSGAATYAVSTTADAFDSAVESVTTTSGSVSTALDRTSGKKATLTITAGAAGAVVTVVGVTATLYTAVYTDVSNTPTTAATASVAKYGTRTLPDDFQPPWIGTQAAAMDHGDYVVSRYQEKVAQDTIALNNYASARVVQALTRKISDRITKRNSLTGSADDYFVEQIERQWQPGGNFEAALGIEKASAQSYWTLGVAGLGEIGSVSRLAF